MEYKSGKMLLPKFKRKGPTQAEIDAAVAEFTRERERLIQRLPDEIVPAHNLVGARYAQYEPAIDSKLVQEKASY